MTQEAAFILNIKGSTSTVQTLNQTEKLISEVTQELKELKTVSGAAEKEFNKLVGRSKELETQSKKVKDELNKVDERMKELLKSNKQASKEYKELKERKQELVKIDEKLNKQIQTNNTQQEKNNKIVKESNASIDILTKKKFQLRESYNQTSKAARKEAADFEFASKAMKDQIGFIPQLEKKYSQLREQIRGLTKDQLNSRAGKQLILETNKTKTQLDTLNRSFGDFKSSIGDYDGALRRAGKGLLSFGKQALGVFGVGGGAFIIASTLKKAAGTIFDFEQSLDKLSSITGLTGQELTNVGNKAIEMSTKFGTSSVELLRIFQLVGSAIPELLKDSEGLTRVAQDADILAKSSGLSVDESVKALALVVAQFQIPIEKTGEVIDILATGAQKGAAEIPDLTAALENVGDTAAVAGLSFETTVATLEALAESGIKGSEAGVHLRNVLLSLAKTGDDELNPALRPLPDILATLEKRFGLLTNPANATSEALKVFEVRTLGTAIAMIKNRQTIIDLDGSLNDYNNALDQANTNVENQRGRIEQLSAAWEALILTIDKGEGAFGSFFGSITSGLTKFLSDMRTDGLAASLGLEDTVTGSLFGDIVTGAFFFNPDNWKRRSKKSLQEVRDEGKKFADDFIKNFGFASEAVEDVVYELGQFVQSPEAAAVFDKETASIQDLTTELKRLKEARDKTTDPAEREKLKNEIKDLQKNIKNLKGETDSTKKTIDDFAKGTIGFLQFKLKDLQEVLENTTDETVIKKTTQQIKELENQIAQLKFQIELFGTEEGSLERIKVKIASLQSELTRSGDEATRIDLTQRIEGLKAQADSIEFQLKRTENLANKNKSLFDETKLSFGDQLGGRLGKAGLSFNTPIDNLFGEDESEEERRLKRQFENEEKLRQDNLDKIDAYNAARVEAESATIDVIAGLISGFGETLAGLFSQNEEDQKAAFKSLLILLVKAAEAQIRIEMIKQNAIAAAAAIGNPLALAKLAAQLAIGQALLTGASALLQGIIGSFETGGLIKDGVPFKRKGTSDNVLIHAKKGEAVLNEHQQARIKQISGNQNIFAEAGVRGFKNAPTNNIIKIANNNAMTARMDAESVDLMKTEIADAVAMSLIQTLTGNRLYERNRLTKAL